MHGDALLPGAGADLVDGLFSQAPQRHRQEMCRIQMLGARQLHEILGHAQAVMDLPAQFIEELILPRAVAAAALLYQQQDGGERIAQVVHHLPQRMAVAGRCLLDAGQIDQADQIAGAAGAQLRAGDQQHVLAHPARTCSMLMPPLRCALARAPAVSASIQSSARRCSPCSPSNLRPASDC